jgi:hypothetical protein
MVLQVEEAAKSIYQAMKGIGKSFTMLIFMFA